MGVVHEMTSASVSTHALARRCTSFLACVGTPQADGEVVEFSNPRQLVPVQYGMMLPRMGEVRLPLFPAVIPLVVKPSSLFIPLAVKPLSICCLGYNTSLFIQVGQRITKPVLPP